MMPAYYKLAGKLARLGCTMLNPGYAQFPTYLFLLKACDTQRGKTTAPMIRYR